MRLKFKLKTALVWLFALGIAGVALGPVLIYNIGLAVAPPPPVRPAVHAPPLVRAALWANAGGHGGPKVVPLTEWSLFSFATCNIYVEFTVEKPERDNAARDGCFDRQAGLLLAGHLSRQHIQNSGIQPSPRYAASQVATMAQFTRTWDVDAMLDTLADQGFFRPGWRGIEAASRGFFGKRAADLTAAEAATLALQISDGRISDPWTWPEETLAYRNRLLELMRRNGAIDDQTLAAQTATPLNVIPLPPTSDVVQ